MHYPFHLGWFALHERARLQPGETLLVHAAAGGTGSGALQMGKAMGAKVIATCGSDEKAEFCRSLGADVVVNYRTEDFVAAAMDATYGHGVRPGLRRRGRQRHPGDLQVHGHRTAGT